MVKQATPRRRKIPQIPILVVEDNADQCLIIRAVLAQCFPETQPMWFNNAAQAITYLEANANNVDKLPRLLLSDLYLPRREDGFTLLEFMKSAQFHRRPPVIVFSSSPKEEDIDQVYSYGVVASYILKPNTYHEWQTCITTFRRYWWEVVTLPLRKQ